MWSKLHAMTLIPSFVVMVIIGILLRLWLGKKDEKYRIIPIQIIGVVLFAIEVVKQILAIVNGYDLWTLPFHFCSLFIFMCPLVAFYRGRFKDTVRIVVASACAMLFLFMAVYPTLIYGEYAIQTFFQTFSAFHAVFFHNLVLLDLVLLICLDFLKFNTKRDLLSVFLTFLGFCIISGTMANVLKTNYNSFYYCQVGPIEDMRTALRNAIGAGWGQFVYVVIISVGVIAVSLASYFLLKLICWLIGKGKKKAA